MLPRDSVRCSRGEEGPEQWVPATVLEESSWWGQRPGPPGGSGPELPAELSSSYWCLPGTERRTNGQLTGGTASCQPIKRTLFWKS